MTPVPTQAPSGPYTKKWGYNYLVKKDAAEGTKYATAYRLIYDGVVAKETEIDVWDAKVPSDDIAGIYNMVVMDNPEIIYLDTSCRWSYNLYSNATTVFKPGYYDFDSFDFDAILAECRACITEVAGLIETKYGKNATKIQKVKVIHDYLILKKEYGASELDQTIAGCLGSGFSPVCTSYALSMKYFCDAFGIQCEIVNGISSNSLGTGRHVWNLINYGENVDYSNPNADYHQNTWYEMDVTWDDPINSETDFIDYRYFNLTTAQMSQSRYRLYDYYPAYPIDNCTGTDLSYANCVKGGLW